MVANQHLLFRFAVRISDIDLQQKAVELGFGQWIGAFLLEWILRREHMEGARKIVALSGNRYVTLLHCLQQGRLCARARTVDLVSHQKLTEHRTLDEAKGTATIISLFENLGTHNVRPASGRG